MKGSDHSGGGGGGTPDEEPVEKEEPREPLFKRFAVPKEWRTKDTGTA